MRLIRISLESPSVMCDIKIGILHVRMCNNYLHRSQYASIQFSLEHFSQPFA